MPRRSYRNWCRGLAALVLAAGCVGAGGAVAEVAEAAASPKVQPAVDGVLTAFANHSLVGLGEHHGLAQEGDFYNALLLDPRFARDVGNVVVEFGSAARQTTLDRYLAGEEVPYQELREVWTDLVGVYPAMFYTMYPDFFAQVRRVNMNLPPNRRIKVWLGDPGIDLARVKTPREVAPLARGRDAVAVALIEHEILARGKKALIISRTSKRLNFMKRGCSLTSPLACCWTEITQAPSSGWKHTLAYLTDAAGPTSKTASAIGRAAALPRQSRAPGW